MVDEDCGVGVDDLARDTVCMTNSSVPGYGLNQDVRGDLQQRDGRNKSPAT